MTGVEAEQFLELIDDDQQVFVLLQAKLPSDLNEAQATPYQRGLDVEFGEVFADFVVEKVCFEQSLGEVGDGVSAGAHDGDVPV